MKRQFRFRQDIKVSLWRSQYFDIEAESYEDALKIAENYIDVDAAADFDCIDNETLYDTETLLYPEGCVKELHLRSPWKVAPWLSMARKS